MPLKKLFQAVRAAWHTKSANKQKFKRHLALFSIPTCVQAYFGKLQCV